MATMNRAVAAPMDDQGMPSVSPTSETAGLRRLRRPLLACLMMSVVAVGCRPTAGPSSTPSVATPEPWFEDVTGVGRNRLHACPRDEDSILAAGNHIGGSRLDRLRPRFGPGPVSGARGATRSGRTAGPGQRACTKTRVTAPFGTSPPKPASATDVTGWVSPSPTMMAMVTTICM